MNVTVRCVLRDRRQAQGISLRKLEELSGIHRGHISEYERNLVQMSVETAAKFALILNCTLDDLFEYSRT